MIAYLSRWVCLDPASNLSRLEREARGAAEGGAEVAVFPESFLHGYTRTVVPARAREAFAGISAAFPSTLFAFGSHSEERRNRMTLWMGGREAARYDKVHLFAPNGEFDLWEPGDRYAALDAKGLTWGLINCNDLRFPEQARALKLEARCGGFLAVAWWPWRRDHVWRTLLRARAIENAAWVLGCCVAASEVPEERFAGAGNYVFDPLGDPRHPVEDVWYDLPLEAPSAPLVDPVASHVAVGPVEHFRVP
jgi:predicted amidohydrolase